MLGFDGLSELPLSVLPGEGQGAGALLTVNPTTIQNDGGWELRVTGGLTMGVPVHVELIGPIGFATEYPCYGAKHGEGYLPLPRSPTLVVVASPPVPLGTYDLRRTQGMTVVTITRALTVYPRNLRSRHYDLRALYSPRMAVGARQREREPLLSHVPPTLATIADTPFTVGVPFTLTPVVVNTSGYALTFTLVAGTLPAGLSLSATTGVISGTPTVPADALNLQLQMSYALGSALSTVFDLLSV